MIEISALWAVVIAAVGLVLTILNIIDKGLAFRDRAKKPEEELDNRISTLENDFISLRNQLMADERLFQENKADLDATKKHMNESTRVIIQSLQALTEHALDNNSVDRLRETQKEISEYLLSKW